MEQAITQDQKLVVQKTVFGILFAISFSHLLNDMIQSIITSVYPLLKQHFSLNFTQIGLITFTFQVTASLLQPIVGFFTDRKPRPYSLAIGMSITLAGVLMLSRAPNFIAILGAVAMMGIGSSIFHPESSRLAHVASGGKKGVAQSIFQLGGNAGSAIGPLLVALIVAPYGQHYIIWFTAAALLGIVILSKVGQWYKAHLSLRAGKPTVKADVSNNLSRKKVITSLIVLLLLIFSKFFYLASMTNYFTFFLIGKFHISIQQSQFYLFIFLAAIAAGTLIGGFMGDRFGRKYVIWFSILGVAPFTLLLPYTDLFWTITLAVIIGIILSSAFSAIVVYAHELVPGKVGMVSGLFFGLAFGMGGLGSALLGKLADSTSIFYVFKVCAFLPLIGIITGFLPNIEGKKN
ncbi:MFS transporter [Mucilaginibacter sp. OK098]|uniref:MFS transporter n=1 Tax=Mucilaginibacter sp. OK098 TaxID=1855297 RepID=UPI000911C892|nr:MFS transporter [Mucilaginibacter sp. OK098]SHN13959.1 MFS transporter, FSR family, fosmidomycin resistance protein [Mucilaginibacter sp. OK098]